MKPKISFEWASLIIFLMATPALGYQLTFQPRISVGVEYTDNVFLDPDNIGEISDEPGLEPESDFIFVTAPGFTAEMLGQLKGLSLSYQDQLRAIIPNEVRVPEKQVSRLIRSADPSHGPRVPVHRNRAFLLVFMSDDQPATIPGLNH